MVPYPASILIDIDGEASTIEQSTLKSGRTLHIREAVPQDAAAVLAFLNRVGGESDNLLFGRDAFPFTVEQETEYISARLGDNASCLLLAFADDNELVSVGSLDAPPRERLSHTAELAISVAKSHWGQGVGATMMTALLQYGREAGLSLIHLGVRADNERAIQLYKRFGFVRCGLLPGFIKVGDERYDEALMTLDLQQQPQPSPAIAFREATLPDLPALLSLYQDLLDEAPLSPEEALPVWRRILADPGQCVILGEAAGEVVSSCVLAVTQNLSRGGRPWAVVENVVVSAAHRRKGYGVALLDEARRIALCQNCYKIMLLTGRKDEGTLAFYRRAGYDQNEKTAFIQRL